MRCRAQNWGCAKLQFAKPLQASVLCRHADWLAGWLGASARVWRSPRSQRVASLACTQWGGQRGEPSLARCPTATHTQHSPLSAQLTKAAHGKARRRPFRAGQAPGQAPPQTRLRTFLLDEGIHHEAPRNLAGGPAAGSAPAVRCWDGKKASSGATFEARRGSSGSSGSMGKCPQKHAARLVLGGRCGVARACGVGAGCAVRPHPLGSWSVTNTNLGTCSPQGRRVGLRTGSASETIIVKPSGDQCAAWHLVRCGCAAPGAQLLRLGACRLRSIHALRCCTHTRSTHGLALLALKADRRWPTTRWMSASAGETTSQVC